MREHNQSSGDRWPQEDPERAEDWSVAADPSAQELMFALGCRRPARTEVKDDEFSEVRFVPNAAREPSIRELAAVMQYVRANQALRMHRSAYRVSRAWADGLWQIGHPHDDNLAAMMDCVLSVGETKPKADLDELADKVITPALLADYDRLIEALEACLSNQACCAQDPQRPCRPRPELAIAFAAIRLRDQAENAVGEVEHRRILELVAHGELVKKIISSPRVAHRLGSRRPPGVSDPAHVLRWAFRQDRVPAVGFIDELTKIDALGTVFKWVAAQASTKPEEIEITDKVIIAGLVLARS